MQLNQAMKAAFPAGIVLATLAVLALALLVYWPGLQGPFVLDDYQNIISVHLEKPDWKGFVYTITHNDSGKLGRVVSITSFVLSGLQYGLEPWGFKFHNLLLHLLTGLLLFRLLVTTLPLLAPTAGRQRLVVAAGVASAFWLLHPLLVSTVLYVVQRMAILSALFTLSGLLCYLAARAEPQASLRYWLLGWLLYPAMQICAIFSKETGVLLPFYILAYEALVFKSLGAPRQLPRRHQGFLLVFVLLPLLVGGGYLLTHFSALTDYSLRTFTLAERLMSQLHVIVFYLKLMLMPRVRDMSLFHDDFPVTTSFDPLTLLLLALLLALVASIWLLRRRAPVLAFGLAWFLVSQLLESTIIPLELVFEHRNYLALAGILLPVVYYALSYKEFRLAVAGLSLFFLVFLLQTWTRVQEWSNEELLDQQAVTDHPRSSRARTTLANQYTIHGDFDRAMREIDAAAAIDPRDAGPLLHKIHNACAMGVGVPEVIDKAVETLSRYPVTVYSMNSMERMYSVISQDKCRLVTPADMNRLLNAALSQAGNERTPLVRGYLYRFQAFQAFLEGQYAQGVIYMRMGFDANGDIYILTELVESQINSGRLGDAEDTLSVLRDINVQHHDFDAYQVARLEKLWQQAKDKPVSENRNPEPANTTLLK